MFWIFVYMNHRPPSCAHHVNWFDLSFTDLQAVHTMLMNLIVVHRPPGHHAVSFQPNGFCFFNSIAIAAKYCQLKYSTSRLVGHNENPNLLLKNDLLFSIHPQITHYSEHECVKSPFLPRSVRVSRLPLYEVSTWALPIQVLLQMLCRIDNDRSIRIQSFLVVCS